MNRLTPTEESIEPPLLEHLSTAVLLLDESLSVTYLNSAAEQLMGMGARKMLGMNLADAVGIPSSLLARLNEAVASGQPYTDRQVSIEPHGFDAIHVDCSILPHRISPPDGNLNLASEAANDHNSRTAPDTHAPNQVQIQAAPRTEKYTPEESISADSGWGLILEINTIDRPLRIARDEAIMNQQEHARLLMRGLAHEIKNPLGGLRGAAQLLEKQLPEDELRDYTSIIIREADRLQSLIDRMLGPASRPRQESVNIHEVLEHVRKIANVGAPPSVELIFDYDPSIPEFSSDRDRLVQVVLNIVVNALQAIGSHGCITLRTRVLHSVTIGSKRHALVAAVNVIDNGPGVPPHLLDQIFYPMVTGTDHGTGLGLSIAQSMINQLAGMIECESEPGNTNFTVLIPMELV